MIKSYLYRITNRSEDQLLGWQLYNMMKLGSVFLISVIMAKIHSDIKLISQYETLLLVSSLFSFFYVSGFSHVFPSFFEASKPHIQQRASSHLFWILQVGGVISTVFGMTYLYMTGNSENWWYLVPYLLFNPASFALEGKLLVMRKTESLFWYGIIAFSLYITGIGLIYVHVRSLEWIMIFMSLWAMVKWAYTIKRIHPFNEPDPAILRNFWAKASPVTISMLLGGSYVYINAMIVERQLSDEDFVLFRYGAREFPLFIIIANSFSTVFSGKIAGGRSLHESMLEFKSKNRKIMHQLFPVAIILMLISPYLFKWVYNPLIAPAAAVFNILLFLLCSRVLFPQTILLGIQKNRRFISASMIELTIGLILTMLLIEPLGIKGASWAMVIAFTIEKAYLIVVCYRKQINFFNYFPIQTYLIYLSLMIAAFIQSLYVIHQI
jgi:O-antigen/teichoic acid export membrane protein